MKQKIKRLIPARLLPLVLRIYASLFVRPNQMDRFQALSGDTAGLRYTIATNQYGQYCVPDSSSHRPAAQTVLSGSVYEPDTIEFLVSNCGNGSVVHAGTYFGDFLPALSRALAPQATLWAFEPNLENFGCASKTIEINHIENVILTHAGLGSATGRMSIQTIDENGVFLGGSSHIVTTVSDSTSYTERVDIVRMDDIVDPDQDISIIQLDVEGYEKEALMGGMKTVKRCLPILILEILPGSMLLNDIWFADNILSLGYERIKEVHGNSVFIVNGKSS